MHFDITIVPRLQYYKILYLKLNRNVIMDKVVLVFPSAFNSQKTQWDRHFDIEMRSLFVEFYILFLTINFEEKTSFKSDEVFYFLQNAWRRNIAELKNKFALSTKLSALELGEIWRLYCEVFDNGQEEKFANIILQEIARAENKFGFQNPVDVKPMPILISTSPRWFYEALVPKNAILRKKQ